MSNKVTITLPEQDILQIVDVLRARQEAYQDNDGIRLGSEVTDSEAELLSMYYLDVIKRIEAQLKKPAPKGPSKQKPKPKPKTEEPAQPAALEERKKVWVTYRDQYKPGEVIRKITKGKNAGKVEVGISKGGGNVRKIIVAEDKLTDRNMK